MPASARAARDRAGSDDEMGGVASMELDPQKARELLMRGLTKTRDRKKLQEYFYEY
jgi:L-asparaginase